MIFKLFIPILLILLIFLLESKIIAVDAIPDPRVASDKYILEPELVVVPSINTPLTVILVQLTVLIPDIFLLEFNTNALDDEAVPGVTFA